MKAISYLGLVSKHKDMLQNSDKLDEALENVRAILSEDIFTKAFTVGQDLTLDDAITEILNNEGNTNE
jgi:hypothetical protein